MEIYDNWTLIDLSHNSINSIDTPQLLEKQKNLETLQLDFNLNLNENGNKRILEQKSLKRMSCKGCGFEKIQSQHFTGIVNIVELNLSKNRISAIDVDAFESNRNLRQLDLTENKLKVLHYLTFSKSRSLEELSLSQNAIELPKNKPFLKCESLKRLTMSNCHFIDLYKETFIELKNMEVLNLNENQIELLPADAFKLNLKLKSLFVETNRLKFIPFSILDYLPLLVELCVDKNTFVNSQEFSNFVRKYDVKRLRTSNCNSDLIYFIENLFTEQGNSSTTNTSETATETSVKMPNINTKGISNFFIGSYLSIILIVQAVAFVLLTLYLIKITKYEKLGSGGGGDVNYANTILNDNDIFKVYKLDE